MTAVAGFAAAALSGACLADGLDTYREKSEAALAHLRIAWSYARTGNGDLAGLEADAFLAAWGDLEQTAPGGEAGMAAMLGKVRKLGTNALYRIDAGKLAEAREQLARARAEVRAFQRDAGIETFADCIWDANRAGDALWVYIGNRPDLKRAGIARRVGEVAAAYISALARCNERASPEVAGDDEFRRLMDGSLKSLEVVEQAVAAGDGALMHRYLIEIISFDRLLYFRYG
jgi:hypothetical protein